MNASRIPSRSVAFPSGRFLGAVGGPVAVFGVERPLAPPPIWVRRVSVQVLSTVSLQLKRLVSVQQKLTHGLRAGFRDGCSCENGRARPRAPSPASPPHRPSLSLQLTLLRLPCWNSPSLVVLAPPPRECCQTRPSCFSPSPECLGQRLLLVGTAPVPPASKSARVEVSP